MVFVNFETALSCNCHRLLVKFGLALSRIVIWCTDEAIRGASFFLLIPLPVFVHLVAKERA